MGREPIRLNSPPDVSLDYYLRAFTGKSLFKGLEPLVPTAHVPLVLSSAPAIPEPTLAERSSDLQLVGIIRSPGLEAIILNKKTQKTLYLQEGDWIGELLILSVRDNGVTLGYRNEKINLNL